MLKSIYAATAGMFFLCFPVAAFAEFDPYGRWFLEGGGYAEKSFLRVELTDWGELYVQTKLENGIRYVTGYDVRATLDASRLNINAWKYSTSTVLQFPVRVPDADPTLDEPFELPPVTYDGLTYKVEFTSTTSGVIWIYGYIDGGIEINSVSTVWKEGTERPDIPDMTSGCNYGAGAAALFLVALFFTPAFNKRT